MAHLAAPWGRFVLISKDDPAESDRISFSRPQHKIGRSAERCDIVLDLQYISSVHCVVVLEGRTEEGVPIVRLEDKSRNGVWVNGDRVGKGNSAHLESGFTVHFTRPGLKAAGVEPRVYKFEVLLLEVEVKPEAVGITQELKSPALGSPQSARPLGSGSPATKKRRRSVEDAKTDVKDPRDVDVRDLASQLEEAKRRLAAVTESTTEINAKHALVLREAEGKREGLTRQVEALAAERQQLVAKTEELSSKLSAVISEHEEREKQLKVLQQQVSERDSELDALKKECDEAKHALEETEAALNERSKQYAALQTLTSDLAKRLAASEERDASGCSVVVDERDRRQEGEMAALRRELGASRLRIRELEHKAGRTSNATLTVDQNVAVSASSSEAVARLQEQLAAARGLFQQIQALGREGELILGPANETDGDSAAAQSVSLELDQSEKDASAAAVAVDDVAAVGESVRVHDPAKADTAAEEKEVRPSGDGMEVEPAGEGKEAEVADAVREEAAAESEEAEATRTHGSDQELAEGAEQGSRGTALDNADADADADTSADARAE